MLVEPACLESPHVLPAEPPRDPREVELIALARVAQALDLRLARHLAWLREQPLETLGYPGWRAFCRERVDWSEGWIRDLLRLIRSGLTRVIEAACRDEVPLTRAVKAPLECTAETQDAWLAGLLPRRKRRPSGVGATIALDEQETLIVWHARHKARLWLGDEATDRHCDTFLLETWREQDTSVIEEALAPAPRPASVPAPPPFIDPATALVGPWREPASLEEGLEVLDALQARRRDREVQLGRLYEDVVRRDLHRQWGYRSVEELCVARLGCSARTMQRYQRLGGALRQFPSLGALPLTKVDALARVVRPRDVERWVAVAGRVGVLELKKAVAHVEAGSEVADELLATFEAAMAETTTSVALERLQAPVPPPLTDRVHPDLPRAALWFLLEVPLPERRGCGKAVELADHRCGNAECRARSPRVQSHHIIQRREGGGDELENLAAACLSCHLRGIHPGHIQVARTGRQTVWTYPGREVTVYA